MDLALLHWCVLHHGEMWPYGHNKGGKVEGEGGEGWNNVLHFTPQLTSEPHYIFNPHQNVCTVITEIQKFYKSLAISKNSSWVIMWLGLTGNLQIVFWRSWALFLGMQVTPQIPVSC